MKPYYEHAGIVIFHGDCREILPQLAFDCVVSDPPYGLDCEFGRRNERVAGDSDTEVRDWIAALPFPQLMFGSPSVSRPPCRAVLVWDKSELTGMGDLEFPWKQTFEEIYVIGSGFKSSRRRGSVLRYPLRPKWTNHPDAVSGDHPTEKPVSLMTDLLECCPWESVIDPTCGVGSTLVAAKKLGKRAFGIDVKEKYCEIAAQRLSQEVFAF